MRIAALALVSAAALVLVGCTPAPHPTTSPKPAATPVFRSDAEALAAAEKAYRAYSEVADQILADGGVNPDRIDAVTTGELRKEEHQGSSAFRSKGYREVGSAKVIAITLQSANTAATKNSKAAVTTYVCLDVSNLDVRDSTGRSVVSPERATHLSYEVTFDLVRAHLLPSKQESWDSGGVCA
jgi:hypothetical protein